MNIPEWSKAKNIPIDECLDEKFAAQPKKIFSEELSDEKLSNEELSDEESSRRMLRVKNDLAKNVPIKECSGKEFAAQPKKNPRRRIIRRIIFRFKLFRVMLEMFPLLRALVWQTNLWKEGNSSRNLEREGPKVVALVFDFSKNDPAKMLLVKNVEKSS
jgi:hypothetical protein